MAGEIETVIPSEVNWTRIDLDFAWQQYNEFPSGVAGLSINPLKPDVWERLVLPRGGAQRHPLEINEGVSGEQDYLNTIFNTHKIRIVCKIWSSYFIVHAPFIVHRLSKFS